MKKQLTQRTSRAAKCRLVAAGLAAWSLASHATIDGGWQGVRRAPALAVLQQAVTGEVSSSADGSPLAREGVTFKGTMRESTTNEQVQFSVSASAVETLVFSFVGYQSQEVQLGTQTTRQVALGADVESIDEVVVVGYGTQRKSDLTGAVGVVTADEILAAPVANALQGMKGRVAGVNVFLNSGSPTASPRILIRGLGTINSSSNPLFVVDGVVMENIQFLNPNDIERMEVLKDASSTAIYGARGANGVVLISTKRGATVGGTIVSYDGFVNVGVLPQTIDVLNSEEWLEVLERGFQNHSKYSSSNIPAFTRSDPRLFDAQGNPLYDTDW